MKVFYWLSGLLSVGGIANAQTAATAFQKDSLFLSGSKYLHGNFVAPDKQKAKYYLLASARTGNYLSMNLLGELYLSTNDPKLADSAIYWYSQAAQLKSAIAFHQLGRIYNEGTNGVQQDFQKADSYFHEGSKLGDANSKNMVAYYLYKGLNGKQDYAAAFALYQELAAQQKHRNAMYFLGIFYRNGYGTKRNADSARYWLQQSALAGYHPAADELKMATPENPELALELPVKKQSLTGNDLYKRVKHNVNPQSLPGTYTGFAARYDWSGQYIISVFPLKVTIQNASGKITGTWIEGKDTACLLARLTDSNLVFSNTGYNKIEHYTPKGPETWQFRDARFDLLLQTDSLYMAGNLQMYNPLRREPGQPLYVHLTRVASPDEKAIPVAGAILDLRAAPNPTAGQLKVSFTISKTQKVTITVLDMQGTPILREEAGTLPAGTYRRDLVLAASLAHGAYALILQAGTTTKQVMIVKQ